MTGLRSTPTRTAVRTSALVAAREALAICESADRIAERAASVVGVDDERLSTLLEERERMLAGLANHVAALENGQENARSLVDEVCAALSESERTTAALAARVADRIAELQAELATVQRAGSAGLGYAALGTTPHVDRVR
jgi:hypothetical protein